MRLPLFIALFGAVGALARFGLNSALLRLVENRFPLGTLAVNVLGSFLLGVILPLGAAERGWIYEVRVAASVGFLGAFTTFSTFSLETMTFLEKRSVALAFVNIVANLGLCLLAAWLGLKAGRQLA